MNIVTRIAPSPTGQMHIGTVRTALFNYLFAKHLGGTYFVRIEDTDKERNKEEWVDAIWQDFQWCGLIPDMKYVQSEHIDRHRALLKHLVESDKAYISEEPAQNDPSKMVRVVRLRNSGSNVTFDDLIRGKVSFDTTELGDFVIARSIDDPLYHFAVVVDDNDAGVTHVIRAEEHISNTPRQILIQEALGFPRPTYAHIPLILAPDRSKLSKRKHGASIEQYRAQGFLPEAVINYLALLGWNPGTDRELFSLSDLVKEFDIAKVQKSGAIFDIEKLRWFNKAYLDKMPDDQFRTMAADTLRETLADRSIPHSEHITARLAPIVKERIHVWQDLRDLAHSGEFDFFFSDPAPQAAEIPHKGGSPEIAIKHLQHIRSTLETIPEDVLTDPEAIKTLVWDYATAEGRGDVLWPLRFSLSGRAKSPDPFTIISIIGKESTLRRIDSALRILRS